MIPNFEKLRVIEFPRCNVSAFHRVLAKSLNERNHTSFCFEFTNERTVCEKPKYTVYLSRESLNFNFHLSRQEFSNPRVLFDQSCVEKSIELN